MRMTLQEIREKEFNTTKDGKRLNQSSSNELKNIITELVMESLLTTHPELTIVRGASSLLLMIENNIEGALPLEVTIVNKPLNIDENDFAEQYEEKLRKEQEKQKKKEILARKVTTE